MAILKYGICLPTLNRNSGLWINNVFHYSQGLINCHRFSRQIMLLRICSCQLFHFNLNWRMKYVLFLTDNVGTFSFFYPYFSLNDQSLHLPSVPFCLNCHTDCHAMPWMMCHIVCLLCFLMLLVAHTLQAVFYRCEVGCNCSGPAHASSAALTRAGSFWWVFWLACPFPTSWKATVCWDLPLWAGLALE